MGARRGRVRQPRRGRARHQSDPRNPQAERLAGNEPDNLAAQLPEDLANPLPGEGGRESFALAEFYRRVAETEGVDESQGIRRARAVALVLQEVVTTGEMDDVRHQLKGEYAEFFGPQGE
jgi:uncharacterized protein (DUF2267 family)